jgi:hypothetical protein
VASARSGELPTWRMTRPATARTSRTSTAMMEKTGSMPELDRTWTVPLRRGSELGQSQSSTQQPRSDRDNTLGAVASNMAQRDPFSDRWWQRKRPPFPPLSTEPYTDSAGNASALRLRKRGGRSIGYGYGGRHCWSWSKSKAGSA